jgi:hypothetical protein
MEARAMTDKSEEQRPKGFILFILFILSASRLKDFRFALQQAAGLNGSPDASGFHLLQFCGDGVGRFLDGIDVSNAKVDSARPGLHFDETNLVAVDIDFAALVDAVEF